MNMTKKTNITLSALLLLFFLPTVATAQVFVLQGESLFTQKDKETLLKIASLLKIDEATKTLTLSADNITLESTKNIQMTGTAIKAESQQSIRLEVNEQQKVLASFELKPQLASFDSVNVVVQNGQGDTTKTNGLGNIIIGYNKRSNAQKQTGSHNIIIGDEHSFTSHSGLVLGKENTIGAPGASVMGGTKNAATGSYSSICGGTENKVSGEHSTILGEKGKTLADKETVN